MSAPQDGHDCSNVIVDVGCCEVSVAEAMVGAWGNTRGLMEE